ncbi:MAG TPA: SMC-Scp complex subunit ScpB [archaeon]|nr:SMC-Scp complex subunit ScpB [archaeon]
MAEYSKEMLVEALLFASSEPVLARKIALAAEITEDDVHTAVFSLNRAYENEGRAFRILRVAEGYQFRTLPEFADYVRGLGRQIAATRLSIPALETLAIIAYRQPITRAEIEKIRGVNVSGILKNLIEKRLITVTGRAQVLGRPLLYGTTREFLRYFGLADLSHLPKESELQVILAEEGADQVGRTSSRIGKEPGESDEQQILM